MWSNTLQGLTMFDQHNNRTNDYLIGNQSFNQNARDWPTMGGSNKVWKHQGWMGPSEWGTPWGTPQQDVQWNAPYAPFHITCLPSGSIVSCSNYDAWQHAGLDSPAIFGHLSLSTDWALSKGKSRASSPDLSWDITSGSATSWITCSPGSKVIFRLGSAATHHLRIGSKQSDSKDQDDQSTSATRKSPYSSASSGLILRFFKISLTSDVQSRPKVQDPSLKLLQDPLQLHLLRFAGHENGQQIFTLYSPIVDQNKKKCRFPIVFPRFSGWTKGKNNKQIKIDVQKSPNSNCQVSSRYQNTPKAPPSTAPQRIWTWLWTPKWYREMATKLLHETKRRRASIFLAEKTWKHVESIVDHLDFCKL